MRFSTIVLFVATALAVPHKGHHKSHSDDQVQQVEKRLAPIALALLTGAGSAAAGWATKEALTQIKSLTSAASNWKEARETFTKTAVDDMMKKIDTDMSWVGAVCYNMGYDVDASKRSDIATLKLKSGPLNTEYVFPGLRHASE